MRSGSFASFGVPAEAAHASDYLRIMRLDHSSKHIFIVPGVVFALILRGPHQQHPAAAIALGLLAALCIASANYTINEWLDRDFDRHHPTKSLRAAVQRRMDGRLVWLQWAVLVVAGVAAAGFASAAMAVIALVFAAQGLVYNVRPCRTKDRAYLDVISESINNPLRLLIGWVMIDPTTLPPSSIVLAYWLGGAFLMASKRLSEFREIAASHGRDVLTRYRASFSGYTETSLLMSCVVYCSMSNFALAVFLIKYRIEYVIVFPFVTALFAVYLGLAMRPGSAAQKPERLYQERGLILLVMLLGAAFGLATVVDMPFLEPLTSQRFVSL